MSKRKKKKTNDKRRKAHFRVVGIHRVNACRERLRGASENGILSILGETADHIWIELNSNLYLFLITRTTQPITPGTAAQKVHSWPMYQRRPIAGYIILCPRTVHSPTLENTQGASLPSRTAVVTLYGTSVRFVYNDITEEMLLLLRFSGVPTDELPDISPAAASRSQRDRASVLTTSNLPLNIMPRQGMEIDCYVLDRRLGRGMSAEVWKATVSRSPMGVDLSQGDEIALKIYFPSLFTGVQPLRIQREFSLASQFSHPNLARVFDLVISPSRPYHTFLAMEYVQGKTLKDHIAIQKKIEPNECIFIATQLFEALREMHSLDALHRDVKAANIMVRTNTRAMAQEQTQVTLMDFGIVTVEYEDSLTMGSVFMGSKHSSPLEQLTGKPLDRRADIYAVGSVLFHCLTGNPMYDNAGPEAAIAVAMTHNPVQLTASDMRDRKWETLMMFVNRCISVDKFDRPESTDECLRQLNSI